MCREGPSLLGRDWLGVIKLNWPRSKLLSSHDKRLGGIFQKLTQLFEEDLRTLQGVKAKIHVDPTASSIFHKARSVPYALRQKIEQDLERLEKPVTIEPVQYSKWVIPIVLVTKSDGTLRLCGDYKLATNGLNQFAWHPSRENDKSCTDIFVQYFSGLNYTACIQALR